MANEAGAPGTDVGTRIAEQRHRAGLTVDEAAERAGMSPEYLAYLESGTDPNPTKGTLIRLAAALNTSTEVLFGAGMQLPPGQREAALTAVLAEMTPAECREHLADGGVGRFLFVEAGRGPVAVPVNFRMDGDDVIFRTSLDDSMAAAVHQRHVSFDVDHIDDDRSEGWSVLLTGRARMITDPAELDHVRALNVQPWAGGDRPAYVRLTPAQVTGRRIRAA
jgi:nitroimidazol reductase NimA-like FMN-containing flavoprotein (pyridoxamine 5'-phosphate oxidase superfamily)/DNA-binding XRE family transcriptional regulator